MDYHLWPGQDVQPLRCAAGSGTGDVGKFGTSSGTAIVGGLMAYLKTLYPNPSDARAKLLEWGYKRNQNGPVMPWNGQTWKPN